MRSVHKQALKTLQWRSSVKQEQLDDICLVVASTHGPLVIAAMIERGLQVFREAKPKRKKKEPSVEKGKAREFDLHFLNGSCRVQLAYETAFIKDEETIRVREVVPLTDDEKRRVEEIRNMGSLAPCKPVSEFLLSLLERAGWLTDEGKNKLGDK